VAAPVPAAPAHLLHTDLSAPDPAAQGCSPLLPPLLLLHTLLLLLLRLLLLAQLQLRQTLQ
jgi:hypothetical protein